MNEAQSVNKDLNQYMQSFLIMPKSRKQKDFDGRVGSDTRYLLSIVL